MDLVDIDTFLSRIPKNIEEKNVLVDYQMLNNNQKLVFKQIESHYHDMLEGYKNKPLLNITCSISS